MKLGSLLTVSLAAGGVLANADSMLYYLGSDRATIGHVDSHKALLALADQLGVADYYPVDDDEETFQFLNNVKVNLIHESPRLVAIVNGVVDPKSFIDQGKVFEIVDERDNIESLEHQVFHKFPKQSRAHQNIATKLLTKEMKLVYNTNSSLLSTENKLMTHFKYFNEKLPQVWKSFKKSMLNYKVDVTEQKFEADELDFSILRVINDKLFINELSQLVHLQKATDSLDKSNTIYIKLNSLISVKKKTGADSPTYMFARQVLGDILKDLAVSYDVVALVNAVEDHKVAASHSLEKRHKEIEGLFTRESGSGSGSYSSQGVSCFSTEEACQAGTGNCNEHGVCTKTGSKCWTCLCSPTFNKKSKKTTRWAGFDCSKKEISSEANLLLWSTLAIVIALVGGVQLLYGIGNEPLPGVLDAATAPKKTV